jgi:hypothetical protein
MSEEPNQSANISSRPLPQSAQAQDPPPDISVACPPAQTPLSRRSFVTGLVGGGLLGGIAAWSARSTTPSVAVNATPRLFPRAPSSGKNPLAMPGLYPGRIIEVAHPGSMGTAVKNGYTERNREAVKSMMTRGMKDLTGADDAVSAWRALFSVGDRVGIKVVPVGKPDSISSYEIVLEVIDALVAAGVRKNDILVFERYKNELMGSHYHEILPDGVHWEASSVGYDDYQLEIDGQMPGKPFEDHVAGYDPDVYRELSYCMPEHDPKDDRRFRSHLSVIVTKKIDKFISIPVLKDHRSSGVTLALKNLSHGLNNNVCRSHIIWRGRPHADKGGTLNQCGTFIPALASLEPLRQKAVLQILDGLVGTWEGGPHTGNKTFATWQYKSLFFATDPVALDRVGWEIIDKKRAAEGWPGVAAMGLDAKSDVGMVKGKPYPEQLHIRQPQHIALAETLGLGVFDINKIEHRRIELT